MSGYKVAIMGATGAVGKAMQSILRERDFPIKSLRLLASSRSVGREFRFNKTTLKVQELTEHSFGGIDLVLSSAGGSISKRFAPIAVKNGAIVVDNTSAFRMDSDVPLVVPEVNSKKLKDHND